MLNGENTRGEAKRCVLIHEIDSPKSLLTWERGRHPEIRIWSDLERDYGPTEPLGSILKEWVALKSGVVSNGSRV